MRPNDVAALLFAALVTIAAPTQVRAQSENDPRTISERLRHFQVDQIDPKTFDPLTGGVFALVYYAIPPSVVSDSFREFLQSAAGARVDQLIGASPSSGAATTTASKTGISELLGVALEAGSLTQTLDHGVATVRANGDGLYRFFSNQPIFTACSEQSPDCNRSAWLKDIELSASFNVSDAGGAAVTGTDATGAPAGFAAALTRRQFSSASFRWAILNKRDLRSAQYREKWIGWFSQNEPSLTQAGADLLSFVDAALSGINRVPGRNNTVEDRYVPWLRETRMALQSASGSQSTEQILAQRLDVLLDEMRQLDPQFDTKLQELAEAYVRYFSLRRSLESTIVTEPALTFEYTYSEPLLQPRLNTIKVAWAYSFGNTEDASNPGTFTLNGGGSWFQSPQQIDAGQSAKRWKDFQFAAQFDRPLGPADSPVQLSAGAYLQFQVNPNLITVPDGATALPGTTIPLPTDGHQILSEKGSIVVLQAVFTIQKPGSGFKIPIGISWSNRTELVAGNEVRGHVGFTFDTSPLALIPGT